MTEEWFEEVQKITQPGYRLWNEGLRETVDYTGGCSKCKKFVRGNKDKCDYNLPGGSKTDYVVGTFCPMKV